MTSPVRIVVTGLGAVSALGFGIHENWAAAKAGARGIQTVELSSFKYGPMIEPAPLAQLRPDVLKRVEEYCDFHGGVRLDSIAQLSLFSARTAVEDASLSQEDLREDTAVVFGHSTGGTSSTEESYSRFFGKQSVRVHPLTIPRAMVSAASSAISMSLGILGPVFSVSSACSSSAHALVQAALLIQSGMARKAIVGGSESLTTAGFLSCWRSLGAMSNSTCRPFSQGRDGMVLGEGGAALVLEDFSHAQDRGAKIYCELIGFGCTSDAHKLTQPNAIGAKSAIKQALRAAKMPPNKKIVVSAHGTGTVLNDRMEADIIRQLFPEEIEKSSVRVIATKSAHGHLLGGSTALQLILGISALKDSILPPIQNYVGRDNDCVLPLVLHEAEPFEATHLVSNSFAFGGLNVGLVFKKWG